MVVRCECRNFGPPIMRGVGRKIFGNYEVIIGEIHGINTSINGRARGAQVDRVFRFSAGKDLSRGVYRQNQSVVGVP